MPYLKNKINTKWGQEHEQREKMQEGTGTKHNPAINRCTAVASLRCRPPLHHRRQFTLYLSTKMRGLDVFALRDTGVKNDVEITWADPSLGMV